MRNISLITINSIRNNLKSKVLTVVFVCITLMIAVGLALFICLLLINPAMDAPVPDRTQLELYLSLVLYTTCLICLGLSLNVFAFQSMTREKSRGNIESLLATPLSVKDVWIAKSLAIFIPGLVMGEVLTFITLFTLNYIYFIPRIGFLFNPWIAISGFLVVPLIYLCLSLLVHLMGLTGKPVNSNVIVQIFLPVIITLMINLAVRNILNAASWSFAVANLAVAAVIVIIIIFLLSRLTRERIVLSR